MKVGFIATPLRADQAFAQRSEYLFQQSGGNTGNFAFVQAISGHIGDAFDLLPWHVHPDQVRGRYDALVIACANQIGAHTDLGALADNLDRMGVPIVAIGLGAQAGAMAGDVTISAGTRRWLEVIAAHAATAAPNFGMRGDYSWRQMEVLGLGQRAAVMGCPSNLLNCDPALPAVLGANFARSALDRVAVPAGHHLWAQLGPLERQLADIVDTTRGLYVAQSELDMIRLARGEFDRIDPDTLAALHRYIRPGLSAEQFRIWCRRHGTCFKDATSWLEAMRVFDFVVGPRFHGVMLALQAGTPGGVIAHDSRTLELCQTLCVPVRPWHELDEGITVESLRALFPFDAAAYARRRVALARVYVGLLQAAGISPAPALAALVGNGI